MEALLLFVESWWWAAPVAAGVGAAGYRAVTTNRRRARRLELDAARHEERLAFRAVFVARAEVRAARGDVLAAKARRDAPASVHGEARRRLAVTKDAERSATLALRASRNRIRAAQVQYHARTADAPLPIAVLMSRQDAVTARWLTYETDPATALSYPQMLDAQHPATLAFLRAQRDAQSLRPASSSDRITPEAYLAYRDAVGAAEAAFDAAERDARGIARDTFAGLTWDAVATPILTWLPRAAELLRPRPAAGDPAPPPPSSSAGPAQGSRPTWPAPAWHPAPPPQS